MIRENKARVAVWSGLWSPRWLLLLIIVGTIGNTLAFWQYISNRDSYSVLLRVSISPSGEPVRPLSELVVWLNGQFSQLQGYRVKWRPFIASRRFEGSDDRQAVVLAQLKPSEQSLLSKDGNPEPIAAGTLAMLAQGEAELGVNIIRDHSSSRVLWVRSGGDSKFLFWILALSSSFAFVLVINLYALVTSQKQPDGVVRG